MSNELAARKAAAVRHELQTVLLDEFGGNINLAAKEMGIPSSTLNRHFSPTTPTPSKEVPLTFVVEVADWLHNNRGREDFAAMWRRITKDIH